MVKGAIAFVPDGLLVIINLKTLICNIFSKNMEKYVVTRDYFGFGNLYRGIGTLFILLCLNNYMK